MAISIIALNRGGCSAHGGAHYDPRSNTVIISDIWDSDEARAITVQFSDDIDDVEAESQGITSESVTISGSKFTGLISTLSGGFLIYKVTLETGDIRRIALATDQALWGRSDNIGTNDGDLDYGAWG